MTDDESKLDECPTLVAWLVDAEVAWDRLHISYLEKELKDAKAKVPAEADTPSLVALREVMGVTGSVADEDVVSRAAVRIAEVSRMNAVLWESANAAGMKPAEAERGPSCDFGSESLNELRDLLHIEGDCNADWIFSEAVALIGRLQTENENLAGMLMKRTAEVEPDEAKPMAYSIDQSAVNALHGALGLTDLEPATEVVWLAVRKLKAAGTTPPEVEQTEKPTTYTVSVSLVESLRERLPACNVGSANSVVRSATELLEKYQIEYLHEQAERTTLSEVERDAKDD